jgi:hypothetical protein
MFAIIRSRSRKRRRPKKNLYAGRVRRSVSEAHTSIGRYLDFYNARRPHSSLEGTTPDKTLVPTANLMGPLLTSREGDPGGSGGGYGGTLAQ